MRLNLNERRRRCSLSDLHGAQCDANCDTLDAKWLRRVKLATGHFCAENTITCNKWTVPAMTFLTATWKIRISAHRVGHLYDDLGRLAGLQPAIGTPFAATLAPERHPLLSGCAGRPQDGATCFGSAANRRTKEERRKRKVRNCSQEDPDRNDIDCVSIAAQLAMQSRRKRNGSQMAINNL